MSSFSKILRVCNYFLVVLIGLSSLQCHKEPIDQDLFIISIPSDSLDGPVKYGYINSKGDLVIEPKYESVSSFSEGLAWVKVGDKYGYIDKSGEMVVEPFKCQPNDFSEGFTAIGVDGKWGYIDNFGDIIIPLEYSGAKSFSEGLAAVSIDGKWGYIDKSENMVIPLKYTSASSFVEGFAKVGINNKELLINREEKILLESPSLRYIQIGSSSPWYVSPSEGLIEIRENNKRGFMNNKGEIVVEPQYQKVGKFSEGLAAFRHSSGTGFINRDGKVAIKQEFWRSGPEGSDPPPSFSEGLARIFLDYDFYFIDTTGEKVFQLTEHVPGSFSEGLALIQQYNRFGYVDTTGKIVIETKYEYASNFNNGLASVKIDGINAYIDKSGAYIWPQNFVEPERELDRSTPRSVAELYVESIVKLDFRLFSRISADTTDIKYLTNKFGKRSNIVKDAKMNYQDLTRQFSNARSRIYFFYREATGRYEGNLGIPENLKYHLEERDTEQEEWGVVYEFNFVLDEVLKSKVIRIYMAKDSNNEWKCFKDNLN